MQKKTILNKIFLIIEIIAVVVALVFGAMWVRDPSGPYEPITFMALLVGSTIVELVRRKWPPPSEVKNEEIAQLSKNVEDLLKRIKLHDSEQQSHESSNDIHIEAGADVPDPMTERIYQLLDARKKLTQRLGKLPKSNK